MGPFRLGVQDLREVRGSSDDRQEHRRGGSWPGEVPVPDSPPISGLRSPNPRGPPCTPSTAKHPQEVSQQPSELWAGGARGGNLDFDQIRPGVYCCNRKNAAATQAPHSPFCRCHNIIGSFRRANESTPMNVYKSIWTYTLLFTFLEWKCDESYEFIQEAIEA